MTFESLGTVFADAGGAIAVAERALALAASAGVIGACAFHWAVIRPVGRGNFSIGRLDRIVAAVGLGAALLLALVVPWRVAAQAAAFASPGDALMPLAGRVLATGWGRAAGVQAIAAVVAAVGFTGARGIRTWGWRLAAGGACVVAVVPAWMGHAAASERLPWLAIGTDALHVAAAGGWAGGVAVLALVTRDLRRQADSGATAAALITQFRTPALTSAGTLLATGIVSALFRLRTPADLIGSTYGLLLLLKLGVIGVAAVMGRQHSLTAGGRAATHGARAVSRSIAMEALVLLVVFAVTGLLAGSPPPGTE